MQDLEDDKRLRWWEKLVIVMIVILILLIIFLIFNEKIFDFINEFKDWYHKS